MKSKPIILAVVMLAVMAVAVVLLAHTKSGHKFGEPGVKTRPIPGGNLEVLLPDSLPGYKSQARPEDDMVLGRLPKDTSFGQRIYMTDDTNFWSLVNVVLMGTDRSSIHKPQICLTGQGWDCDNQSTRQELIPIEAPFHYDLPVNKYVATKQITDHGTTRTERGLYVYWYVDGTHYTADQWKWMSVWMPKDLVLHGLLERWAYISYFSVCAPGQEEATFERMKKLIAATVPRFQTVPGQSAAH